MTSKTNLNQPALNSLNWNVPLNSNFAKIDNAFGGRVSYLFSNFDITATSTELQNMNIYVIGSLLADVKLIIPSGISGFWIVNNSTTGSSSVSVYQNSSFVQLPLPIQSIIIFSDGTSVFPVSGYNSVPSGTISAFAGSGLPNGWLFCYGGLFQTTGIFANLYAAIGNTWGGTPGVNFAVPDLRGYFLRGTGTNSDGTAGPALGAKQTDSFISHSHTITDPGHKHGPLAGTYIAGDAGTQFNTWGAGTAGGINGQITTATSLTGITSTNTASTPAGGSETRPKNSGVSYIIKI